MRTSEEPLGGRGAIGTADVKIVHGRECRALARAEAMAAVVIPGQWAVAPFDRRTAALKQGGAVGGDLLDFSPLVGRRLLHGMGRLLQGREQLGAERLASLARLGTRAARGGLLQIEGRNQRREKRLFQFERQRQRFDARGHQGPEEGHCRDQLGRQPLGLGEMLMGTRGEVSGVGEVRQAAPDRGEASRDRFWRLCRTSVRSYGRYN